MIKQTDFFGLSWTFFIHTAVVFFSHILSRLLQKENIPFSYIQEKLEMLAKDPPGLKSHDRYCLQNCQWSDKQYV